MFGNSVQGGYIGNVAGNPFGSDFLIPRQSPGEADRLFRYGMDNTESGEQMKQNIERVRKMLPQAMQGGMQMPPLQMNPMGNVNTLFSQINTTYPQGELRWPDGKLMGGEPEYSTLPEQKNTEDNEWMEKINRAFQTGLGGYTQVLGNMNPRG
jgi:hypothetical protein